MTAHRRARVLNGVGVWLLSSVLLLWTLLPIYNIIRVSMQEKEEVLSTSVIPVAPARMRSASCSARPSGCWRHSGTRWETVSSSVSSSRS